MSAPNRMKPHPLTHDFTYSAELSMEDTGANHFAMPLFASDAGLTNPEDVQVNPRNDNYQTQTSWQTFQGSIVSKVNVKLSVCIPPGANVLVSDAFSANMFGTKVPAVKYDMMPIAMNLDDIVQENHRTGETVGVLLGLQKEATNENQVHPIFENANELVSTGLYPIPQGGAFSDLGLDIDMTPENVAFSKINFETEMRQDSLGPLLKAITQGGFRENVIYADRPFYNNRWVDVPSRVKRQHLGCYCGFLVNVPQATDEDCWYAAAEVSAISHLRIKARIFFNEYNDLFDQS